MATMRVEVRRCDGPACPKSTRDRGASWLRVGVGETAELDFCGWDCLVNHAISAPDLGCASGGAG